MLGKPEYLGNEIEYEETKNLISKLNITKRFY